MSMWILAALSATVATALSDTDFLIDTIDAVDKAFNPEYEHRPAALAAFGTRGKGN